MSIEGQVEKLEAAHAKPASGRALLDRLVMAAEAAKSPDEAPAAMHSLVRAMNDDELLAVMATTDERR